jgi:hypothetical protein
VGVRNRRIPHAWHQDTGGRRIDKNDENSSGNRNRRTVLLGFPALDNYEGVGVVFSHFVRLERERWAPFDHPEGVPIVYKTAARDDGGDDDNDSSLLRLRDEHVVRPRFGPGREILPTVTWTYITRRPMSRTGPA